MATLAINSRVLEDRLILNADKLISSSRHSSTATVLGCADTLNDDIATHGVVGDVICVSATIADYRGPMAHAVCFHANYLDALLKMRKVRKYPSKPTVLSHQHFAQNRFVGDLKWEFEPQPAGSGILAILIAAELGYEDVRVLGVTGVLGGKYYDVPRSSYSGDYSSQFQTGDEWAPVYERLKGIVRVSAPTLRGLFRSL